MTGPQLPDPREDLHWGSWTKAIHEVFNENALNHPERQCVVETTPWRAFSYRQINQASNVLANHLVSSGIQRGEVVMVYAHRGVDLVVAYMGVLKAGATVSVVDPLYPPDRQVIYLDVARPRGLIVIKKATEAAGELSPTVTSFMEETLQLRTIVPELVLNDDGKLSGGFVSDHDMLDACQGLVDIPGVVVGPDSTPTLSFTSGSEGRPKGVRGRHFSLLHYFPWMAERFGLSENDRFTMLSGIAHDPIQRDIFTPLFLGAQLYVPSSEDIQHELLAAWMAKYETTVTHLTPAMGQILVGGATTQFPALKNAFFVGDVLIKRDVRRLQELAENCVTINMFGTTETQRAVSYYAVSSRNKDPEHLNRLPEVIPAGRGMKGVQMLVVDRTNRTRICDVGETGEIFVRAAGLAEGYLGLDDLTNEKFVDSWFVDKNHWVEQDNDEQNLSTKPQPWREFYKGPRDRLYRSGDLGRYLDTGDVVCTGRIDNQVKIRGFRIELGEIDSHLSAHPYSRENVTVLRKDADEDATLVTYVVPELSALRADGYSDPSDSTMTTMLQHYRKLRGDLREYLKTKVPTYAVPSMIIPLSRMPINPNGKVDKPKLPIPSATELSHAAERVPTTAKLSSTEKEVATIWGSTLKGVPADTIDPDDSYFDLGGNSIKAMSMLTEVRKRSEKVRLRDLYEYPTLGEFAKALDGQMVNGNDQGADDLYSLDAVELAKQLPLQFPTASSFDGSQALTVLLTGATGFLGSFILARLLEKSSIKVIALVRGGSSSDALGRIQQTCAAYGLWSSSWAARIECMSGDLAQAKYGLAAEAWTHLASTVDVIIHNGARVDWLLRYRALKASNVLSTVSAINLAAVGKPKNVTFVSSTAVLDTEYCLQLSQTSVAAGSDGIAEDDTLEGCKTGLGSGYGQTKWTSEYLLREAGKRGLAGCVVRPGYVLGDSRTGASITDDFLIRMLKGCVQLGSRPRIANTINMVPVNHVARIVVAAALHPPVTPLGVAHVTPHPRISWSEFLGSLEAYGYVAAEVEYPQWRDKLLDYVEDGSNEEHAVLPLLDLVTSDFSTSTMPRILSDRNAATALRADDVDPAKGSAITQELVGLYLAYLVQLGFMPQPAKRGKVELPKVEIGEEQWAALKGLSGRGAVATLHDGPKA